MYFSSYKALAIAASAIYMKAVLGAPIQIPSGEAFDLSKREANPMNAPSGLPNYHSIYPSHPTTTTTQAQSARMDAFSTAALNGMARGDANIARLGQPSHQQVQSFQSDPARYLGDARLARDGQQGS